MIAQIWLVKLLLAHLLTDFVLQPKSWVAERNSKHFASPKLYFHGFVTGLVALFFAGLAYWPAALIIMITHVLIDAWKSYQKEKVQFFIIDQSLHMFVILACWVSYFLNVDSLMMALYRFGLNSNFWLLMLAIIFLTSPAGILIGQLTKGWREKILNPESLANAGKWIGIIERLIVFIFVLVGQYAAISLLIAAKGIIRFNEKDRPEVKTEYLVIGTLMSIGIALIVGVLVKELSA